MDLDEGSEFLPDSDPPEQQDPIMSDEYVNVDKEHGPGEGSSSPEVISSPEGDEGETLTGATDTEVIVGVPVTEEPDDDETVPMMQPPPIPELTSTVEPPPFEADPLITFAEDPPEDFPPPDLPPPAQPEITTSSGVEDVVRERRPIKPFITTHTESFASSPKMAQSDLPRATGYLSFLNALHPLVLHLIYWKDVKLSGAALVMTIGILFTLCMNTMLHAVVLVLLASMVVSLVYIVTKVAIDSFYNREIKNPFLTYLQKDLSLPEKKVLDITVYVLKHVNCSIRFLVRLVLFDRITASLKFMVALFLVSYVTNCLDILTSLFIAVVLLFSVPPIYSQYQEQIDFQVKRYVAKLTDYYTLISRKIPFLPKVKEE